YSEAIEAAVEREIDSWPLNLPFAVAPRMQAITLDVIMAGIFGIEGAPGPGTAERRLRAMTKRMVDLTASPAGQMIELRNARRAEPIAPARPLLNMLERPIDLLIERRRRADDLVERRDILSMLLQARTEAGEELSSDE